MWYCGQRNEEFAKVCRERDELKRELEETKELLEAAKNAQGLLQIHLVKVQEERDALFEEARGLCHTCKKRNTDFDCEKKCYGHQRGSAWEWKGVAADRG